MSDDGEVKNYLLRQQDPKRESVKALKQLRYSVFAAGDSYNDTTMLSEADRGFLFRSPDNVKNEFSQFKSTEEYGDLMQMIRGELEG